MRMTFLLVATLVLLGATVGVGAASSTASMTAGVTVVRSCAVGTQAASGTITLACSNGVNQVNLGSSSTSDIRPLVSGSNALTPSSATRETSSPSQPLVVTLNF